MRWSRPARWPVPVAFMATAFAVIVLGSDGWRLVTRSAPTGLVLVEEATFPTAHLLSQRVARFGEPSTDGEVLFAYETIVGEGATRTVVTTRIVVQDGSPARRRELLEVKDRLAPRYEVLGRGLYRFQRASGEVLVARATYPPPGAPRELHADRLLQSWTALPFCVSLLALMSFVVAATRSRGAWVYTERFCGWVEAELSPDGILSNEGNAAFGILARGVRLPPGPVLVDPSAVSGTVYRDLPIVGRSQVVVGDHARWTASTLLRLRDARVLSVVAMATALLALAGRVLAGATG